MTIISAHESWSNVSKELSPYLIIVTMPELRGWALTSLANTPLQVSFKFCPKCGKDLANNKERMWKTLSQVELLSVWSTRIFSNNFRKILNQTPGLAESNLSKEKNNEEDIEEQVHVRRISRAKLSSVIDEDSEDDLPFMLCSTGTSTSTLNFCTDAASTASPQSECDFKTLKDISPNRGEP